VSDLPARQQPQQMAPVTRQALAEATDDYEKWSRDWAFVRAVRAGRVSFVVHVHTGTVRHINYDGGPVPNFGSGGDW
jgi:hypothetical protein